MYLDKTKGFEMFYKQFQVRNYKKSEMLIRADDDPLGIFCLRKGYVRQYTISETGFELTLHILKPISYFPMVWAINGTPNVYFFEAFDNNTQAVACKEIKEPPIENINRQGQNTQMNKNINILKSHCINFILLSPSKAYSKNNK